MRVAIAGAGLMAYWHAYYARRCGASLVGVADPNGRPTELKQRFRGASVFDRVERMLEKVKPEVLHVCTPAPTHEHIIELALAAGVHVLVEKPVLPTAAATQRLLAESASRGLILAPVHQYVFQRGVVRARTSLIELGTPLHFDAVICSAGGSQMPGDELDQLVSDIMPHPFSLLDSFFPGILDAVEWTSLRPAPGESRVTGTARGMSISILVSLQGRPTESSARLTATGGTAWLDLFHGFSVVERGRVSRSRKIVHPFSLSARTFQAAAGNLFQRAIVREPAYPGLKQLIGAFYDAAERKADPPLSTSHTLAVARARERLRCLVHRA